MSTPPAPPPPAMRDKLLSWAAQLVRAVCAPTPDDIAEPVRLIALAMRDEAAALRAPTAPPADGYIEALRELASVLAPPRPGIPTNYGTLAQRLETARSIISAALGTPLAAEAATERQGQQGPPLKSPYGHVWGKPYDDGYATCRCGAREDTRSRERCPAAEAAPDVVDGQCRFCGERDGTHGAWCRR